MASHRGRNALTIARKLGLAANLRICLDPGDAGSYPGSGQTLADLSGNGCDFYLGSSSGSESSDPTFNGAAGRLSAAEYFSTDGADRLKLIGSNPSFIEQITQDNAAFTIAMMAKIPSPGGSYQSPCGTRATGTSSPGFELYVDPSSHFGFIVAKASNTTVFNILQSGTIAAGAWGFYGVSIDEAAGAGGALLVRNAVVDTFTSTYSSPTTVAASSSLELLNGGSGNFLPLKNGGAAGPFWLWERPLKAGELLALYQAIRGRYGL